MADAKLLSVERDRGVVWCTIANPPRNLMNRAMVTELDALTREVAASRDDRVLVLTGAGSEYFIAHYDVAELSQGADKLAEGAEPRGRGPGRIHEMLNRLGEMPQITIAALNGTAMGGGCELSLACDFRLMSDGDYRYGLPETSVGILPGGGGTQRMTRLLGTARALDLLLHAKVMRPADALEIGLIHRLYPAAEFAASAREFARDLADRAPIALAQSKRAIRRGAELPLAEGLAIEAEGMGVCMRSADARGAMRASLQGERYEFKGE
jgi:enoyl-CoA hydratase